MAVGYLDTPMGLLRLCATQRLLTAVELTERRDEIELENPVIARAREELTEYFAGRRQQFTVPFRYGRGTEFQIRVWDALQQIPYGQTRTYGQLAALLGQPKAARAVGRAVGENPLLILVPCHRVVASRGLGGFRYGPAAKEKLLALEGILPAVRA